MVTNPRSREPVFTIVKTLVAGLPTRRANVSPPLKKNTLIGTPTGTFASEKAKGVCPGWDAVSVCARTAVVPAFSTLMIVADTVPVIVAVAAETPLPGADVPPESLLQAKRARLTKQRRLEITALTAH